MAIYGFPKLARERSLAPSRELLSLEPRRITGHLGSSVAGPLAHPIAQLSGSSRRSQTDGLDKATVLGWENTTSYDPEDEVARSLKVRHALESRWGCLV